MLDTSAFLKWAFNSPGLTKRQKGVLADEENDVFFSRASAWEIVIKAGLGKLLLKSSPQEFIEREMEHYGFLDLPIERSHIFRLHGLPPIHRDPFDRLLIAQASVEGLPILSVDRVFKEYKVRLV